jgi:ribonuclease VapC
MFIDASALTAILADEEDARLLSERLEKHDRRITSPLAVWEATIAVARILDETLEEAHSDVERFLALSSIEVVDIPASARFLAIDAAQRYGKGRHPAALNFGDCFAYACAKLASAPMLYKGDDFALTDIAPA